MWSFGARQNGSSVQHSSGAPKAKLPRQKKNSPWSGPRELKRAQKSSSKVSSHTAAIPSRRKTNREILAFLKRHNADTQQPQEPPTTSSSSTTSSPMTQTGPAASLEDEQQSRASPGMLDTVAVTSRDGLYQHRLSIDLLCLCPVMRCMLARGPFEEALRSHVVFRSIPGAALRECVRFLYALKTNQVQQHSVALYSASLCDLLRASHFLQLLPLLHKTAQALANRCEEYMSELIRMPSALLSVVLRQCDAGALHLLSQHIPSSLSSSLTDSSSSSSKPYSCPIDFDALWQAMLVRNVKLGRISREEAEVGETAIAAKRLCAKVFLERISSKFKLASSEGGVGANGSNRTLGGSALTPLLHASSATPVNFKQVALLSRWFSALGGYVDSFRIRNGLIGGKLLGQLIAELKHVSVLDVRGVGYGVEAGLAVVKNVRTLQNITALDVENTAMSVDGLRALVGALVAQQQHASSSASSAPMSARGAVSRTSRARIVHNNGPVYMFGSLTPRAASPAVSSQLPSAHRRRATALSARKPNASSNANQSGRGAAKDLSARQIGALSLVLHQGSSSSSSSSPPHLSALGNSGESKRSQQQQQLQRELTLVLSNNPFGDVCITALADRLTQAWNSSNEREHSNLRSLIVNKNHLGYKGAVLLASLISGPPARKHSKVPNALRVLHASRTWLEDLGVRRIAAALCENESVLDLDLSECISRQYDGGGKGYSAGSSLGKMLAVNQTLTSVNVSDNYFPLSESVVLVRGILENSHSKLLCLDLSGVPLDDSYVATRGSVEAQAWRPALVGLLQRNVMRDLRLNQCQLTGECLCGMAEQLQHNSTLQRLELAGNQCTPEAMAAFGTALTVNQSLVVLDLSAGSDERSHRLRNEGCVEFARCLVQNRGLQHLNLSHHGVRNDGFALLLQAAMSETSKLDQIVLQHNHIDRRGMLNAAALLSKLQLLLRINGHAHHHQRGSSSLLRRGVLLDLRGNPIGEQEQKEFQQVLPRSIITNPSFATEPEELVHLSATVMERHKEDRFVVLVSPVEFNAPASGLLYL